MATVRRNLSVSEAPVSEGRRATVAAADVAHLAQVDTHVLDKAVQATEAERSMTLWEGIKTYPKAVGWSVLLSTCIIMEGFDLVLVFSLLGLPEFQKRFGIQLPDGTYEIPPAWQSGLTNGATVGEICGLLFVGYSAEHFGYRKTLIGSLILIAGFVFIAFFAKNLTMLVIAETLCGLPWGAFQTLTTTYAAEVCPVSLRAYLTTYVNLCWVIGQFLSSGVLKGVANKTGPIAYKLPYGLQWIWPVPLIIGILLAPESPWWCVRKGRIEDAKKNLLRLTSRKQTDFDPDATVDMMIYTVELEKANTAGVSYLDCFKGVNLRRTEIVCMVWIIQVLCGCSAMVGYSTYFFERAGLNASNSFSLSLGQYALGAVGVLISWFLMTKFGRRDLYFWGQVFLAADLIIVGGLGISHNTNADWGIGALILIFNFMYDATVGPVCYSLVAELSSTRLRNKTVVLARSVYNVAGIINNILTPRMLSATSWNWGAKTGFFWAGSGILCCIWTWFRLPEPKGRTYAELDILFDAKIPARKFASTEVSSFDAASGHSSDVFAEKVAFDKLEEA